MANANTRVPGRSPPAGLLLLGTVAIYGAVAARTLLHGHSSPEEVAALIRSWWYVTGAAHPYTATDATWSMPLYFFQLGWWQQLAGLGPTPARALSIAVGALDGILLFLVCKRLTANTVAAAASAFLFLATPAVGFSFATATTSASVTLLHLAAIWLMVASMGRPQAWASLAMGVVLAAMVFYRQDMILAVIVLAPLFIAATGKNGRWLHAGLMLLAFALTAAAVPLLFPHKLVQYAAHVPVLAPFLERIPGFAPNFTLIDQGSAGAYPMTVDFARFRPREVLEAFVLPYGGIILLALALFPLAGKALKLLWIAPLYFLWLALTHVAGTTMCGADCLVSAAPSFAVVGALAAGIAFALIGRSAKALGLTPPMAMITAAVAAVAINAFAPALAPDKAYRFYPVPRWSDAGVSEGADTIALARWLASLTTGPDPVLAIHSLGRNVLPALPYAVFLAQHPLPVQSFDPPATHRAINARLPAARREAVQAAIEDESLWTDDTLRRWIDRDYDLILFQADPSINQAALLATIAARFEAAGNTTYQGSSLTLYKRRLAQ